MAVQNGMLTLEDSARIKIARGITTPQEASRVLGSINLSELAAFVRDVQKSDSNSNVPHENSAQTA